MIFVINTVLVRQSGLPFVRILFPTCKLKMHLSAEKLLRMILENYAIEIKKTHWIMLSQRDMKLKDDEISFSDLWPSWNI